MKPRAHHRRTNTARFRALHALTVPVCARARAWVLWNARVAPDRDPVYAGRVLATQVAHDGATWARLQWDGERRAQWINTRVMPVACAATDEAFAGLSRAVHRAWPRLCSARGFRAAAPLPTPETPPPETPPPPRHFGLHHETVLPADKLPAYYAETLADIIAEIHWHAGRNAVDELLCAMHRRHPDSRLAFAKRLCGHPDAAVAHLAKLATSRFYLAVNAV